MAIKQTTDKAAVVDTENKWIPIVDKLPPRGSKILLINKHLGSTALGHWSDGYGWTHWYPLPTFAEA